MKAQTLRTVLVLEIRKEGTQDRERIANALARTHVNLRNDLRRLLRGTFLVDVSNIL